MKEDLQKEFGTLSNDWNDLIKSHHGVAKSWISIAFSYHDKSLKILEHIENIYDKHDEAIKNIRNKLDENINYETLEALLNENHLGEIDNNLADTNQIENESITKMKTSLDQCKKLCIWMFIRW